MREAGKEESMTQPVLAILGGQGPLATLRFQQLLINHALNEGAVSDESFLSTITLALPSGLDSHGMWSEEQGQEQTFLRANLAVVNASPATHLVMPCNTMHLHEEWLRKELAPHITFISLREVLLNAEMPQGVEIWTSERSRAADLYAPLIASGARYAKDQDLVNRAIIAGMAGREVHTDDLPVLPDVVLLACTDLSVHKPAFEAAGVQVLDSLVLLADEIWRRLG